MNALISLVKKLIRRGQKRQRLLVLLDSRVVVGAASKGRSSSWRLNRLLRELGGWCLAVGFLIEYLWVRRIARGSWAGP